MAETEQITIRCTQCWGAKPYLEQNPKGDYYDAGTCTRCGGTGRVTVWRRIGSWVSPGLEPQGGSYGTPSQG